MFKKSTTITSRHIKIIMDEPALGMKELYKRISNSAFSVVSYGVLTGFSLFGLVAT